MKIVLICSAGKKGFSLIEVTIAMAIAAVALVSLMALIPQGMNTMIEAGDEAITARIHQQILNELQMADFDAIENEYRDLELYYDSQGEEIGTSKKSASVKGAFVHIYSARVTIPPQSGGVKLPRSVGGGTYDGFSLDGGQTKTTLLRPVIIEVAAVSGLGATFDWEKPASDRLIRSYQSTVAKMGQAFKSNSGS